MKMLHQKFIWCFLLILFSILNCATSMKNRKGVFTTDVSTSSESPSTVEMVTTDLSTSGEFLTTDVSTSTESHVTGAMVTTDLSTSGEFLTTDVSTSSESPSTVEMVTTDLSTSGEFLTTDVSTSSESPFTGEMRSSTGVSTSTTERSPSTAESVTTETSTPTESPPSTAESVTTSGEIFTTETSTSAERVTSTGGSETTEIRSAPFTSETTQGTTMATTTAAPNCPRLVLNDLLTYYLPGLPTYQLLPHNTKNVKNDEITPIALCKAFIDLHIYQPRRYAGLYERERIQSCPDWEEGVVGHRGYHYKGCYLIKSPSLWMCYLSGCWGPPRKTNDIDTLRQNKAYILFQECEGTTYMRVLLKGTKFCSVGPNCDVPDTCERGGEYYPLF